MSLRKNTLKKLRVKKINGMQKMNNFELQEKFLNQLAKAYDTYDVLQIDAFVAKNFNFSHIWQVSEMKGRDVFLCYLAIRLEEAKKKGLKGRFLMTYRREDGRPMLLSRTDTSYGGNYVFIATENKAGKIKKLEATVPGLFSLFYKDKEAYEVFVNNDRKIIQKEKKIICPHCGSEWIADILYGEPAFDDELEELLEKGEIHLGGCCIFPDSPKYHCNDCKKDFTNTAFEL